MSGLDQPSQTPAPPTPGGRRVVDLESARAQRSRFARLRARRRGEILAAVVAALALLAWILLASPLLRVHRLEVSASSEAAREVATKLADSERGHNVFLVDTAALAARIEQDSRIADATVRRGFPRSLAIEVVARVPVLGLNKDKGQVELLDHDGHHVETVASAPRGVPVVAGGDGVADAAAVQTALTAVAALPESVRTRIRSLAVDNTGSLNFRVGATTVIWGTQEQAPLKAKLVQVLLTEKPKGIDVSAPETPVTT